MSDTKTPEQWFLEKYPYQNKPYLHQQAYLERFWRKPGTGLFADMGTGKTYMLINNAAMLYDRGRINAMLIVAPKGVYANWPNIEIPKHMPTHINYHVSTWRASPTKKQQQEHEKMLADVDSFRIFVMNIESFSSPKGLAAARLFLRVTTAYMAIDESTTIKNPKATRTKNIIAAGKDAHVRRIATGSPITKNPMDVYSQCEFLGPQYLGFTSFYAFQQRYGILIKRKKETPKGILTYPQLVGYRRLDELREKLKSFTFRVTKEQCLDLPPKVFTTRDVELSPEQKKMYKSMETSAHAMHEGRICSTTNGLTKRLRMHQIVCGFLEMDDGELLELPNSRLEELLATVEEVSGKVIIWANYRHNIRAIYEALCKEYGEESACTYYGDTDTADRASAVSRFQDPEDSLRFFIANAQTGAYGLTLTQAQTVIYYSNNFDLDKRWQSEDRAHRIGQTGTVTYVDLVCRGTIDEDVFESLRNKIDVATEVHGEARKDWVI